LLLITFWSISFCILFHYTSPVLISNDGEDETIISSSGPKLVSGPFRYIRFHPQRPLVRLFSIEIKSATSSCGTVGLFRTGGYRTLFLDQVHLFLNMGDTDPLISGTTIGVSPNKSNPKPKMVSKTNPRPKQVSPWEVFQKDIALFEKKVFPTGFAGTSVEIDYGLPDLGNTLGIEISQFECTIYQEPEPLHIRSQTASWSAGHPEKLVLRGHVIIGDGRTTLEGNALVWDIRENRFRTDKPIFVKNPVRTYVAGNLEFDTTLKTL
jgi:hypothetical protein